jgi:negative regulator of flagellin synthesis FlgM
MQIDPIRLQKLAAANLEKVAPAAADPTSGTSAAAPAGADRLVLSPKAAEVQAAQEALAAAPEVRAEKIAALKAQIAAGTYQVNAEKIAEKIVPD